MYLNLQPYRLSPEWPITAETLHEQLAKRHFHPCGAQDVESRGWVAPCDGGELVHAIGDNWLVCMQTEAKILPPAVINKEADKRAAEIALMTGELLRLLPAVVGAMGGEIQRAPDLVDQAKEAA